MKNTKVTKVRLAVKPSAELSCECGGTLRPTQLPSFDFSSYAGFHVKVEDVPGLKCTKCAKATLDGGLINIILKILVVEVTKSDGRLSPHQAKFLRRVLAMTQQELATRMGIDRVTVGKWESNMEPISAQHDLILRVVVLAPLLKVDRGLVPPAHLAGLLQKLQSVRTEPPAQLKPVSLKGYPITKRKKNWGTNGQLLSATA